MRLLLLAAPVAGGLLVLMWWLAPRDVDKALRGHVDTLGVPLWAEVDAWLRPRLVTQTRWQGAGAVLGLLTAFVVFASADPPGDYGFYLAFPALAIGSALGAIGAALRGLAPAQPWRRRLASVRPRTFGAYLSPGLARATRGYLLLAFLALGLALVSLPANPDGVWLAGEAAVCLFLLAACWGLATRLLAAPVRGTTPDQLVWQEQFLASTVDTLARQGMLLTIGVVGVVAGPILESGGYPTAVSTGAGLLGLATLGGMLTLLGTDEDAPWVAQWRRERATTA